MEDDPEKVVKEIPVYVNRSLEGLLYVLQFPQRPATHPTADFDIQNVKYKAHAQRLQITYGLDTEAETFDPETSALLAEAAEGIGLDEDSYAPDKRVEIDKGTLEGTVSTLMTSQGRYVVGVVRGGGVTLLPLGAYLPMAPAFPHLNQAEKARAAFKKSREGGGDSEEEDEEPSKVTVKFARTPGGGGHGGQGQPSKASSFAARKQEEDEPWSDLQYEDGGDGEWLGRGANHTRSPFYVLPRSEYLPALFPRQHDNSAVAAAPTPSVEDMKAVKSLPEQLKLLFVKAKILPYKRVFEFVRKKLNSGADEATLMRALQTVASLLRPPVWVVRSDVLYPDASRSCVNGIPGTILQRARDTILSEFRQGGRLERRRMVALTRLPVEEVTEIFEGVAERVEGSEKGESGWELKWRDEDGEEWSRKWPEVVQRQALIWEMKAERSRGRRRSSSSSSNEGGDGVPAKLGGRRRSRGKSESGESNNSGGEDSSGGSGGPRRRKKSGNKLPPGIPSKVES